MKITFIGSSHGVPEAHRKCSCIMMEIGGNIYFLDMGTNAIDALRKRDMAVEDVKAVFVTHMHGDHTNGLISFIDLITWYFKSADPVVCLPDIRAGKIIRDWLDVTQNRDQKNIRYREIRAGIVYDDGCLKMTAIPTRHCENSFAYLAEAGGKRILFTGDLQNPKVDFPVTEGKIDLAVCEAAHFEPVNYLPLFESMDIHKVCFTHYSDRFLSGVLDVCRRLNDGGIPALRAMDDTEIKL